MPDPTDQAVAIVGLGGLFPGAPSIDAFWQNIVDGFDAITDVPADRWDPVFFEPEAVGVDRFYCRRGGFVDASTIFDPTEFGIMPVAADGAEPDQLIALSVAAAALADAGDPHRAVAPDRVGVIIGRGGYLNPGVARLDQRVRGATQLVESLRALVPDLDEETLRRVREDFQSRLGPEHPEASIGLVPNLVASRIANRLDLQGPAYTIDAACASSLLAVERGRDELLSGRCDVMVVGGVHHCHDLTLWSVFTQLRALSASQYIRPFSKQADGILIGEGTGLFVLKRLADAERDDDRIYAVVRGSGTSSDGRDASLMSPRSEGQVLALRKAWRSSGLDPATVGLVEAHGTATAVGDAAELATLRAVFGGAEPGMVRAGLGSVKSMIGHAMPAAAAAGLTKTALALFHGVLPPTLHVEEPNEALVDTRFRLISEAEPWEGPGVRRAGVNAFGFGGINAHLIVESHRSADTRAAGVPTRARTAATPAEDVLALAGADAIDLLAQLDVWERSPTPVTTFPTGGPARLAIVDPTGKRLALARKVLERGTPFRGRNDVWFEPNGLLAQGGSLAFLFPGVEPEFAPRVSDVATQFGLADLPDLAGRPPLEAQSLGIIAVGRMLSDALARLGVTPDLAGGHSLGEWTGQIVTGMIPAAFIDPFLDGLRPGAIEVSDVVFVALGAGAEAAAMLLDGLDEAFISHDNCTHQSVVCVRPAQLPTILERAAARKVVAQEMPFRSGFHSPLFEPFVSSLAQQFEAMSTTRPAVPLWSATVGAPYPDDPVGIAELSLRHLVEPVRFRTLVESMHDAGARVFVQVGPGSLGAFVDDTLRDRDHLVVATTGPRHGGLAALRRAIAALWVAGASPDLAALGPQRGSHPLPLALGTTLVRGLKPIDLEPATTMIRPGSPPTVVAFRTVVDEAAAAAREVLAALDATATTPTAAPVGQHPRTPVTPLHSDPPTERVVERTLSLEFEPAWRDHAFFPQPSGWPHVEDTFPLVPMTGILELLADEALVLVPGMVAIAVEDVRAMRWLAVEPAAHITIRTAIVPDAPGPGTVVAASIDDHARARIRFADAYPTDPPARPADLEGLVPMDADVDRVYADGHLFHGPAYQGLVSFDRFARNGAHGRLRAGAAPGALLDNAGQLFGYWLACAVDRDRLVLPTSIDRIAFFGPHPKPGAELTCTVFAGPIEPQRVRCDIELAHDDGTLWCRIDGWEDRRFATDDRLFRMLRDPSHLAVAELQPGGWTLARESWPDTATRDVVHRRYLSRDERAAYAGRNPNAQRQSLLGRVAAKDAVRLHRWERGSGAIFPLEVEVANDDQGRPFLVGEPAAGLSVSLAHTGRIGVALVGTTPGIGVDVVAVEPRDEGFEAVSFAQIERDRLAPLVGVERDREIARFWAAKEAAAKAAGTGIGGRPRDWVCLPDGPTRFSVNGTIVETTLVPPHPDDPAPKEHYVAWTPTER